jgi:hypothetical protein
MAVPVVAGCILKNSPDTPQFTYDSLQIRQIGSNTVSVKDRILFQPTVPGVGVPTASIRYDYVEKQMIFSKPLEIIANSRTGNELVVNNESNCDYVNTVTLDLKVFGSYGTKTEPYNFDGTVGILQMSNQNKLFFQYTAAEFPPDSPIAIINQLLPDCSVILKDIWGINNIDGGVVTLRRIGEANPTITVSGIPPDDDGICRGMLLFL